MSKSVLEIVCVGSIGVDLIFKDLISLPEKGELVFAQDALLETGGCASNVGTVLSRLGRNVALIGCLGEDLLGHIAKMKLAENGVETKYLSQIAGYSSGIASVHVYQDGERSFVYHPGANARLSAQDIYNSGILNKKPSILHFSDTFLLPELDGEGAQKILLDAKSLGVKTSLDVSWDPDDRWLNLIQDYFPSLNYFFCNEPEALKLTGSKTPEASLDVLSDLGASVTVIKLGEKGCILKQNGSPSIHAPAFSTNVVDTTGAGDCFVAAFLHAQMSEYSLLQSAIFANACGALSIQKVGATNGIKNEAQLFHFLEMHHINLKKS